MNLMRQLCFNPWYLSKNLFDAQTLSCFMIIFEFYFFKSFRKTIFFLKNALIIHCTFPVLFLINNLLIPDMSCISYCLTSVYLNCFYQFLPFIFIGRGFFFTSCHSILVSLSSFLLEYYINVQNTFLCYFVNFIHLI